MHRVLAENSFNKKCLSGDESRLSGSECRRESRMKRAHTYPTCNGQKIVN